MAPVDVNRTFQNASIISRFRENSPVGVVKAPITSDVGKLCRFALRDLDCSARGKPQTSHPRLIAKSAGAGVG
jgi:hypothetical protein